MSYTLTFKSCSEVKPETKLAIRELADRLGMTPGEVIDRAVEMMANPVRLPTSDELKAMIERESSRAIRRYHTYGVGGRS